MRARTFNISQKVKHPDTGAQLINEDIIIKALTTHKLITRWAYILHDKDPMFNIPPELIHVYVADKRIPPEKVIKDVDGNYVMPTIDDHWHIVLESKNGCDTEQIARWLGIPENFVNVPKRGEPFLDCVEYLLHSHPKQKELGKHEYDPSEIKANFDWQKEVLELLERRARNKSEKAKKITDSQKLQLMVLQEGLTMKQCRDLDPLSYIKVRSTLPALRLDYLSEQPPPAFRMNIYVDGPGGVGKNAYCEYLAEQLYPNAEKSFFRIGSKDGGVLKFDGYDGEPVIIWDDIRAYQLITSFSRSGAFDILDSHPTNRAQDVKYARVILTNTLNIINGVSPYSVFLDELSGNYTDKFGKMHEAEDQNQVFRRFPMILRIREEDFDVLFNRGFVNKDSSAYATYDMYANVRGSIGRVMKNLGGDAKKSVLVNMSKPVLACVDDVIESHDTKISDIDQLPDEYKNYGDVTFASKADVWSEYDKAVLDFESEAEYRNAFNESMKRLNYIQSGDGWLTPTGSIVVNPFGMYPPLRPDCDRPEVQKQLFPDGCEFYIE